MNNRKNNDLFNNEDYLIHETLYKYTIIHTMLQVYTICTQTVVAWFIHFKRHIMANTNKILYEY